jgi:hypothetical protein
MSLCASGSLLQPCNYKSQITGMVLCACASSSILQAARTLYAHHQLHPHPFMLSCPGGVCSRPFSRPLQPMHACRRQQQCCSLSCWRRPSLLLPPSCVPRAPPPQLHVHALPAPSPYHLAAWQCTYVRRNVRMHMHGWCARVLIKALLNWLMIEAVPESMHAGQLLLIT